MITSPIPKPRRTKEEIESDEREKRSLCEAIGALIGQHFLGMKEAEPNTEGFRVATISIGFPVAKENKPYIGIQYKQAPVAETRSFVLDDGQKSLPLTSGTDAQGTGGPSGEAQTGAPTVTEGTGEALGTQPPVEAVAGPAKSKPGKK